MRESSTEDVELEAYDGVFFDLMREVAFRECEPVREEVPECVDVLRAGMSVDWCWMSILPSLTVTLAAESWICSIQQN